MNQRCPPSKSGQRFFYAPTPVDGKRGTDFKSVSLSFLGRMEEIYGSNPIDQQCQAQAVAGLRLLIDGGEVGGLTIFST
jgi:hypothetical protein